MSEKNKKRLTAAALALFIVFSLLIAWFIGRPLIRYMRRPEQFRLWVDGHGLLGRLAFIGMTVLQVIVAIIPGEPLELGAGYAFGFWEGTLLCEVGILLGTAIVYLFVHKCGRKAAEVFFPPEKLKSLRFLQNEKRLDLWVFILFFIPGTPKDIITYFVPLTNMRMPLFLLISGVARVPSLITSTISGDALGTGQLWFGVIIFAATALISALGLLVYRAICARRDHHPD